MSSPIGKMINGFIITNVSQHECWHPADKKLAYRCKIRGYVPGEKDGLTALFGKVFVWGDTPAHAAQNAVDRFDEISGIALKSFEFKE